MNNTIDSDIIHDSTPSTIPTPDENYTHDNGLKITNYIYIPSNKFYKEVQEMIEDEEISFYNINDWDKIKYNIEKIVKKNKFTISELCKKESLLENIIEKINKNESNDTNTLLLYADDNNMYEFIYFIDFKKRESEKSYNDTNELGSITNINLEVIYNDGCIIKTNYTDGVLKNDIINNDDLLDIIYNVFFHTGVLISESGTMTEIVYTTENPNYVIGDGFIKYKHFNILDFTLLLYIEKSDKDNEIVSKLVGENIKGRVFIMLLCPISSNRIWNIRKTTIENILKILDDNIKLNNILDEIEKDEKIQNPFFFTKKNCI
jgi:hypothetical protein